MTKEPDTTMSHRLMMTIGIVALVYMSFMLGCLVGTNYEFDFNLVIPGGTDFEAANITADPLENFLLEQ